MSAAAAGAPYTTLLFDLDGTLTNSDPVHLRAFQDLVSLAMVCPDYSFPLADTVIEMCPKDE